ncbi:peptidase S49 [Pokkaliibacter plantistimulans]|uniref:Peptidase S49 n=2 Tax=Pseudomonadota TaxID=1224 RepID=A0ABX5M2S4_9GAMM|nr:signal peptide peptidase SppA [Pokkaliibacter plantistimulans]PPC79403.1 signal peptide peptidase SppA [Pokkaliibacter plantistimulans]PXF33214.1 peptidase S49 [Pokkaliibacter plantistimulans]
MSDSNWRPEGSEQQDTSSTGADKDFSGQPLEVRTNKEWRLIEKVVLGLFKEQRRARRWGIFFKLATLGYFIVILLLAWPSAETELGTKDHVALIDLKGVIADGEEASADAINASLRDAFADAHAKAVILRINSPGGSPVQAGQIYDEIKRLRGLHPDKKLYAVIDDIGASGGYYVAAAADDIYADKASIVGSIGVISSGFGFVQLMDKLGVERRTMTSGKYKNLLDPFSPRSEEIDQRWQAMLDVTHQQFIDEVKKGRGDRLKDAPDLFTGMVWTGQQAVTLGLIDGLGSVDSVAREVVGLDEVQDYAPEMSPWQKLTREFGVSVGRGVSQQLGLDLPLMH